jgi:hypothetical protein
MPTNLMMAFFTQCLFSIHARPALPHLLLVRANPTRDTAIRNSLSSSGRLKSATMPEKRGGSGLARPYRQHFRMWGCCNKKPEFASCCNGLCSRIPADRWVFSSATECIRCSRKTPRIFSFRSLEGRSYCLDEVRQANEGTVNLIIITRKP